VLKALGSHAAATGGLPFALPTPLPVRDGAPGATYVVLSSGDGACIFERIPGGAVPNTARAARAIGRATAQLVNALAKVSTEGIPPSPNPQFRNV
jgi:Ser/Thr protein kinase RdoA (MazF antagonist)